MGALRVRRFAFWVSGWVGGGSGWRKANPFDLRVMSGASEDASLSGRVTYSYTDGPEGGPDPDSGVLRTGGPADPGLLEAA